MLIASVSQWETLTMSKEIKPSESRGKKTVTSADGTEIAFWKSGTGSPLVLVHGTVSDHRVWEAMGTQSPLEERFTVYAIDRRGHGESGTDEPYEIERVFEDVAAVVDTIDEPVTLFGISSGGVYALEAVHQTDNVGELILYEPAVVMDDGEQAHHSLELAMELLTNGDEEEALSLFLQDVGHLLPEELDEFRSSPYWQDMSKLMHTVPNEIQAFVEYEFDPDTFRVMNTPTLLIHGSETSQNYKDGIKLLDDTLPNTEVAVMEGRGHVGCATAPDVFIDLIDEFVQKSR